jgi:hypothetical protein
MYNRKEKRLIEVELGYSIDQIRFVAAELKKLRVVFDWKKFIDDVIVTHAIREKAMEEGRTLPVPPKINFGKYLVFEKSLLSKKIYDENGLLTPLGASIERLAMGIKATHREGMGKFASKIIKKPKKS